jgi:hypothetical protein
MSIGESSEETRAEARWIRSSFSADGNCVEVAWQGAHVLVRDSKDRGGPCLKFSTAEWQAFLDGTEAGEFSTRTD